MAAAEAKELEAGLGPEARAGMTAEEKVAQEAVAAERAAVESGATHAAGQAAAIEGQSSRIVSSFHSDPAAFSQSVHDANELGRTGRQNLKNEDPAAASSQDKKDLSNALGGAQGAAETKMISKFSLPSGKTLAGLGISAFCAYSIATFYATDGKTINITNVKILNSSNVQITYNPPNSTGFSLQVNDTLDFSGAASGCTVPALGTGVQVIQVIDNHNCVVADALTSAGGVTGYSPSSAGSPVPTPSCSNWGSAVVHSSLANQFIGSVTNTSAAVCNAAAGVANSVINAAAPVASNLINTGSGLAKDAFCDTVPFLCNSTNWWILGGICLCIILCIVMYYFSKN
jgi:hypothetical protein